jgi:hypothetical protein
MSSQISSIILENFFQNMTQRLSKYFMENKAVVHCGICVNGILIFKSSMRGKQAQTNLIATGRP